MEWATAVAAPNATFYHNGTRKLPNRNKDGSVKAPPTEERDVIAWDMEGMNLSGDGKPQHPVIFGCSSEIDNVLVDKRLTGLAMLEYIIDVGSRNPFAIHVGYGFRYDGNMILQDLPEKIIVRLWQRGEARIGRWYIRWIPGKMFTVSKRGEKWHAKRNKKDKVSVTIYDYSSFFGGSKFIDSAEQILREKLSEKDRETIAHGKDARGDNTWNDLTEVLYYWRAEIRLMQRVFEEFRNVMCKAGFPLKEWYGPGALANFINARHQIRPKLRGVQTTSGSMPTAVHEASKRAFSGGRFELFQAGRIQGPVYAVDINSAYPYALTMIPSFEQGEWVHVENPTHIERFGLYRIAYHATHSRAFEPRPMPLFWRDHQGLISFPNRVHGWYASPEARMVLGMPGAEILEGWTWQSPESDFPWKFLREMYQTRMRLGKSNLLSIPFKLGPNSLYGKYAQTVGWDRNKKLPPKSHALPVAAWITSFTRAKLWSVIRQIPDRVIAVETDSVFFTGSPSNIDITIGDGLGEWSIKEYEEIVYIQSGMYHTKSGGEWTGTKSRGLSRAEYPFESAKAYLSGLVPGESWQDTPLKLVTKPRFIGAGAALNSNAPFKTLHCSWQPQKREITLGETGKRRHAPHACAACKEEKTPWETPHRLMIGTRSDGETMSFPRRLPWESVHTDAVEQIRKLEMLDKEMITR